MFSYVVVTIFFSSKSAVVVVIVFLFRSMMSVVIAITFLIINDVARLLVILNQ